MEWRREALAWAKDRGWVTPIETHEGPQSAPKPQQEAVAIEMGTGWEGATEGLRKVWDRVVTVDAERNKVRTKSTCKTVPDILASFQTLKQTKDSTIKWIRRKAGIRKGEVWAIWASPSCKPWSIANHLNDNKPGAKRKREEAMEEERFGGLQAVLTLLVEAWEEDSTIQFVLENPGQSAIQHLPEIQALGAGVVVQACSYGEVKSGKTYRIWMTKDTQAEFKPILPTDEESECEECKAGRKHTQTKIPTPKEGRVQQRVSREGLTKAAVMNRLPPKLAEHLSRAMKTAREKLLNGKRE